MASRLRTLMTLLLTFYVAAILCAGHSHSESAPCVRCTSSAEERKKEDTQKLQLTTSGNGSEPPLRQVLESGAHDFEAILPPAAPAMPEPRDAVPLEHPLYRELPSSQSSPGLARPRAPPFLLI